MDADHTDFGLCARSHVTFLANSSSKIKSKNKIEVEVNIKTKIKIKIPTPSASLRAGTVAKNATRVGYPPIVGGR